MTSFTFFSAWAFQVFAGVFGVFDGNITSPLSFYENIVGELRPQNNDNRKIKASTIKNIDSGNDSPKKFHRVSSRIKNESSNRVSINIESGDTFCAILQHAGFSAGDSHKIANAISKVYNISNIQVGKQIKFIFSGNFSSIFEDANDRLILDLPDANIEITKSSASNNYSASLMPLAKYEKVAFAEGKVLNSLYKDGIESGIPSNILHELIGLLRYEIDFQRDIIEGAKFKVLYTYRVNEKGTMLRGKNILYASLESKNSPMEIYRYDFKDGRSEYFHPNGTSIKHSLLRTPVTSARISSGYGKRIHPILGYSKMHKGLDYAALKGTPVLAAGSGRVQLAKYSKSYGYYIKIRHNEKYETLYAHLNKFASGIKDGVKVKQGSVIGYVGATGMAKGAHLHYEVHANGQQINPSTINKIAISNLGGKQLIAFKDHKQNLHKVIEKHSAELYGKGDMQSSQKLSSFG
ncbi:MAG: M23 family metallopeptidase [Proteobacteria bacterium]|nr:M23 family metallopeptidase [Pseudomonadota bacterium]